MQSYLWVATGSALGGVVRHWCSVAGVRLLGETFPWATLFVNVTGSLLIGIIAALIARDGRIPATTARDFLMVGVLGGFTTFSAFSLQTLQLMQTERWLHAGLYIAASVLLCLIAVWAGYVAALSLNGIK